MIASLAIGALGVAGIAIVATDRNLKKKKGLTATAAAPKTVAVEKPSPTGVRMAEGFYDEIEAMSGTREGNWLEDDPVPKDTTIPHPLTYDTFLGSKDDRYGAKQQSYEDYWGREDWAAHKRDLYPTYLDDSIDPREAMRPKTEEYMWARSEDELAANSADGELAGIDDTVRTQSRNRYGYFFTRTSFHTAQAPGPIRGGSRAGGDPPKPNDIVFGPRHQRVIPGSIGARSAPGGQFAPQPEHICMPSGRLRTPQNLPVGVGGYSSSGMAQMKEFIGHLPKTEGIKLPHGIGAGSTSAFIKSGGIMVNRNPLMDQFMQTYDAPRGGVVSGALGRNGTATSSRRIKAPEGILLPMMQGGGRGNTQLLRLGEVTAMPESTEKHALEVAELLVDLRKNPGAKARHMHESTFDVSNTFMAEAS